MEQSRNMNTFPMGEEPDLSGYAEISDELREHREKDKQLLYEQMVLEGLSYAARFRYKEEE